MRPIELRPGMLVGSDIAEGALALIVAVEGHGPDDRVLLLRSNRGLRLISATVSGIASLLIRL